MSHSLLYEPIVTSVPYLSPVRTPIATFPSHIPDTCYTNTSVCLFSSELKTTSTPKSPLFLLIK